MSISHHVFRILTKKHGLTVSPDAAQYLSSMFSGVDMSAKQLLESLDFIAVEYVAHKGLASNAPISKDDLETVVNAIFQKSALNQSVRAMDHQNNQSRARDPQGNPMDTDRDNLAMDTTQNTNQDTRDYLNQAMDSKEHLDINVHNLDSFTSVVDTFNVPRFTYRVVENAFYEYLGSHFRYLVSHARYSIGLS